MSSQGNTADSKYCFQHTLYFKTEHAAKKHQKNCLKLGPYACNLLTADGKMCGKIHNCGSTLFHHAEKQHGVYLCSDCEYVSKTLKELHEHTHIGRMGSRAKPYKCNKCYETFTKRQYLARHKNEHVDKERKWKDIFERDDQAYRKGFKTVRSVHDVKKKSSRQLVNHDPDSVIMCVFCPDKDYTIWPNLRRHIAMDHLPSATERSDISKYLSELYQMAKYKTKLTNEFYKAQKRSQSESIDSKLIEEVDEGNDATPMCVEIPDGQEDASDTSSGSLSAEFNAFQDTIFEQLSQNHDGCSIPEMPSNDLVFGSPSKNIVRDRRRELFSGNVTKDSKNVFDSPDILKQVDININQSKAQEKMQSFPKRKGDFIEGNATKMVKILANDVVSSGKTVDNLTRKPIDSTLIEDVGEANDAMFVKIPDIKEETLDQNPDGCSLPEMPSNDLVFGSTSKNIVQDRRRESFSGNLTKDSKNVIDSPDILKQVDINQSKKLERMQTFPKRESDFIEANTTKMVEIFASGGVVSSGKTVKIEDVDEANESMPMFGEISDWQEDTSNTNALQDTIFEQSQNHDVCSMPEIGSNDSVFGLPSINIVRDRRSESFSGDVTKDSKNVFDRLDSLKQVGINRSKAMERMQTFPKRESDFIEANTTKMVELFASGGVVSSGKTLNNLTIDSTLIGDFGEANDSMFGEISDWQEDTPDTSSGVNSAESNALQDTIFEQSQNHDGSSMPEIESNEWVIGKSSINTARC